MYFCANHGIRILIFSCFLQGLKMPYFSNKPPPTPGPDLPRPSTNKLPVKDEHRPSLKRKLESVAG